LTSEGPIEVSRGRSSEDDNVDGRRILTSGSIRIEAEKKPSIDAISREVTVNIETNIELITKPIEVPIEVSSGRIDSKVNTYNDNNSQ